MKSFKYIFTIFLIWRIFIFIPVFLGGKFLPLQTDFAFLGNSIFSSLANFDGVHYLSIAENGYTTNGRFFPLFPMLIHFLSPLFLGNFLLTGIILANLLFFISLVFIYKLLKLDFSENIARWGTIFLLVFPTSFFFGSVYSESLFLLLLVTVFYFARTKRWFLVGVCGFLLVVTRLAGLLILPALIYELYKNGDSFKKKLRQSIPLLMVPLGLIIFSWFSFVKWGSALNFINGHGDLSNGRSVNTVILFPQTIYRYLKILISVPQNYYEWWVALLEITTFFLVFFLLIIAFRKRIRKSYMIFSALAFLLPVLSGTFTGLPRYVAVLFPIYITLALVKGSKFKIIYAFISAVLLFILVMLFSRGYFIA